VRKKYIKKKSCVGGVVLWGGGGCFCWLGVVCVLLGVLLVLSKSKIDYESFLLFGWVGGGGGVGENTTRKNKNPTPPPPRGGNNKLFHLVAGSAIYFLLWKQNNQKKTKSPSMVAGTCLLFHVGEKELYFHHYKSISCWSFPPPSAINYPAGYSPSVFFFFFVFSNPILPL